MLLARLWLATLLLAGLRLTALLLPAWLAALLLSGLLLPPLLLAGLFLAALLLGTLLLVLAGWGLVVLLWPTLLLPGVLGALGTVGECFLGGALVLNSPVELACLDVCGSPLHRFGLVGGDGFSGGGAG